MPHQVTVLHDRGFRFYHKLHTDSPRISPELRMEQEASVCALHAQFIDLTDLVQNLRQALRESDSPEHALVTLDKADSDVRTCKTTLKQLSRRSSTMEVYMETEEKLANLKSEWNRVNRQLLTIREALTRPNAYHPHPQGRKYSVFISHSGEDKDSMAIPLYHKLEQMGVPTFLDAAGLRPGDNGQDEMVHAMQTATIGVFILSPEFAAKQWPMKELNCFLWRWYDASHDKGGPVFLVPVFYRLGLRDCKNVNDLVRHDTGFTDLLVEHGFQARADSGQDSLESLEANLKKITECTGIENHEHASNELSIEMSRRRDLLQRRIVDAVADVHPLGRGRNCP